MKKRKPDMKNSSNKEENTKSNVSEPEAIYQKKTIKTFPSFEEANEADAKAKAKLSPEQHLMNVTKRIKEMYADELRTPMDKNLKFRND